MNKSIRAFRNIFVFIFVIILVPMFVWNAVVYQKKKILAGVAEPFQAACQTASGCLLSPAGWQHEYGNVYFKDGMEYTATFDRFGVGWHIGPDVWLIARGGRNRPLKIEDVNEFRISGLI